MVVIAAVVVEVVIGTCLLTYDIFIRRGKGKLVKKGVFSKRMKGVSDSSWDCKGV